MTTVQHGIDASIICVMAVLTVASVWLSVTGLQVYFSGDSVAATIQGPAAQVFQYIIVDPQKTIAQKDLKTPLK